LGEFKVGHRVAGRERRYSEDTAQEIDRAGARTRE
jgi:hypothetical protein